MAAEAPMDRELLAKNWRAFALIGLAGWVDAVGYLALSPLFVSFMSGNSMQLGVYVTGTLVRVGQELAEAVTGRGERWAWSGDALLWVSMVAGAAGGAASFARLDLRSLALPATAALVLAVAGAGRTGSDIP